MGFKEDSVISDKAKLRRFAWSKNFNFLLPMSLAETNYKVIN